MIETTLAVLAINGVGVLLYWASRPAPTHIDLTPLPVCACARPALPGSHGPDACHVAPQAVRFL